MPIIASKKVLGAAAIGNFAEVYDFAVFGFSIPFIAAHFFPNNDAIAGLLSGFAVYAVAFLARPLGGIMFGYLLDRFGRVRVLATTIWLMAAATALIGLIPTYQSIGLSAPILLVMCRFAQGLSWGGEITGSTTFVLESAPAGRRGRWVGLVYFFGNIPNSFVALLLVGLQLLVSQEAYLDWAWRIPFLAGGLIGVVGWWLRRNLDEPEEYKQASRERTGGNPFRAATRQGWKSMTYVAMILPVQAASAILLLGFMYTFLTKEVGMDSKLALVSNAAAIAVYAASIPLGGVLADRFGRKSVMIGGVLWIALTAYLAVWLASRGTLLEATIGQILIAIGSGVYGGGCLLTAVEVFPTSFRATGHAMAYQLTVAVFGGLSPLASQWLVSTMQSPLAPGVYVTVVALISFILVFFVPETRGVELRTSLTGNPNALMDVQIVASPSSGMAQPSSPGTVRSAN